MLEAVLSPNSNIQEHFLTVYTQLVLRGNTLAFQGKSSTKGVNAPS